DPRVDPRDHRGGIARVARRTVCAAEHHQVMVAVRLPDHLGIAGNPVVAVVDEWREPQWYLHSACMLTVPVDRIAEVMIGETEEAQPVGQDRFGLGKEVLAPFLLFVARRRRPLADTEIGYPEPRLGERIGASSAGAAGLWLQSHVDTAPQHCLAQAG